MNRSSGFFLLLAMGLAVFAVVFLLFGDDMGGSYGSGSSGTAGGNASGDLLGVESAVLETKGVKPKSDEELAAEKAAQEAAARAVKKEDGVFGLVSDARGRPIAGAVVKMLPDAPQDRHRQGMPDGAPIAAASTNERGEYVVGPSPPDGYVKLRAEATGFAASLQRAPQRGVRVDFILDRGGALDLRVIDMLGAAVGGASVQHIAAEVVSSAVTDEDGRVRFASLPTGTGSLVVTKPGYGSIRDQNLAVAPGVTEERTLVLPQGLEIRGLVVQAESERPLAGVVVAARYPNLPALDDADTPSVKTDEEGRFKLTGFVSGQEQMVLRATLSGYAEGRVWINAMTKGEVKIQLVKPGEAFEGRVVDADGQPRGAVTVTYAQMQMEAKAEVPSTQTKDDGSFVLARPAWAAPGDDFAVIAFSDDAGLGTAEVSIPEKDDARAPPLEIKLGGTGALAGTVRDAGGQPVQGALVSLSPDWKTAQEMARGGEFNWQQLNVIGSGEVRNLSAVTGMDGTYRIPGVPALGYQVTASFGLDQFTLPEPVTVRAGDTATADVALGQGGTIEGWILDSDNKPVAGAYVSANPANNQGYNWWRRQPTARSQSDGKFVLRGITDAAWNLWAYAAGYGSAQHQNARKGDNEIQIRLKSLGWIDGVVSKGGEPYAGMFTVLVQPVQDNNNRNRVMPMGWGGGWMQGQQQRTFNTSDGRFQVKGLNAADYTVQASTNDGLIAVQQDVVTVMDGRASREAQLELTEGAIVTGTVRDDETGQGVPNCWVYANGVAEGGRPAPGGYAQTDAKGKYELKGLGRAAYKIIAYVGGTPVTEAVDLQPGDRRTLDLVKQPPGTLQITVVDEKDAPLADARPNVQTSDGNYVGIDTEALRRDGLIGESYDWRAFYQTNAAGILTRYHVPPGVVLLTVWRNGYVMEGKPAEVVVASARVTEVVIKMRNRATPAQHAPAIR